MSGPPQVLTIRSRGQKNKCTSYLRPTRVLVVLLQLCQQVHGQLGFLWD
jgi:hypothetical protein